jgi:hypothetical protein
MRIAEPEPDGPEKKCQRESLRRCLQAKAYPAEVLQWELEIVPCYSARCPPGGTRSAPLDELLANGGHEWRSGDRYSIPVSATYEDITTAARLEEVFAITVSCGDSAFCSCADLPADRCDEHAFCWQVSGWAFHETCMSQQKQPLGCSGEEVCESSETDMIAPDGRRWKLPSSCRPAVPGWRFAGDSSDLPLCNDG